MRVDLQYVCRELTERDFLAILLSLPSGTQREGKIVSEMQSAGSGVCVLVCKLKVNGVERGQIQMK